jgi:thioredoxin-related protein
LKNLNLPTPAAWEPWLTQLRKEKLLAIAMISRPACPFCEAIRREQLLPMLKAQKTSATPQKLVLVEFDFTITTKFEAAVNPGPSRIAAPESPRKLAQQLGIRLAPTLLFLGWDKANGEFQELTDRLVGYGSRDFFSAYLDERIEISLKRLS